MTRDDDFIGQLEGYLEDYEGNTPLPEDVRDAIRAELPSTHQRPAWWPARRFLLMTTPLRWGAVAATAAAVLIGVLLVSGNGPLGIGSSTPSPSASPSASRSVAPSPTPVVSGSLPQSGPVIQGSYTVADPFPIEFGLEIGPGWSMWSSGVMGDVVAVFKGSPDPPAGLALGFLIVDNVLADPCDPSAGIMDPPVGPAPIDLAEALASQTGTDSTDPVPVEIDGYSGVFLDYRNTGEGDCFNLERWPGRDALAGERDQVWILDVDGTRLVIDAASFEGTADDDVAEMRTIVESMTIAP